MKSSIFATLIVMAGMAAALMVVHDPSNHQAGRVYIPDAGVVQAMN